MFFGDQDNKSESLFLRSSLSGFRDPHAQRKNDSVQSLCVSSQLQGEELGTWEFRGWDVPGGGAGGGGGGGWVERTRTKASLGKWRKEGRQQVLSLLGCQSSCQSFSSCLW